MAKSYYPLYPSKECPSCGYLNMEDAESCEQCGQVFVQDLIKESRLPEHIAVMDYAMTSLVRSAGEPDAEELYCDLAKAIWPTLRGNMEELISEVKEKK